MYRNQSELSTSPRAGAHSMVLAGVALFALSGLAPAQRAAEPAPRTGVGARAQPPTTQEPQRPRGGFLLQEGDHDLRELLDRAAAFLHRNIMVNDTGPLPKAVHLQNSLDLDEHGCEAILSQLLYAHGWALTPMDPERGLWEVINLNGPRRNDVATRALQMAPEEVLRRDSLKVYVVTHVPLRHVRASSAANALRPFFLPTAAGSAALGIGAASDTALLLHGFADQVAAAIRLVQNVDQPDPRLTQELDERLRRIEARLAALESASQGAKASDAGGEPAPARKG